MSQAPSLRLAASRIVPLLLLLVWGLPALAADRAPEGEGGSKVPAEAAEKPELVSEEGHKNTLKWTTASEKENLGYDVYRSESQDGPFTRITEKPVPGAGTTDETNKYEYVDKTIDPRKAYYYYVEAISFSGLRARFTPIIRAAPKIHIPQEQILKPERR